MEKIDFVITQLDSADQEFFYLQLKHILQFYHNIYDTIYNEIKHTTVS
jgi:hypothetical protein